ncbi:hypothetical protein BJV78DRAFT_1153020 [Lactifluus subvellereus]|nr:hypothetical protein BJV78DRAFT_1153020 [Lactifluus subvellereus]
MSRSVGGGPPGGAEPEIVTQVPGSEGVERNGTALGPLTYVRREGGDSLEFGKGENVGGSERGTSRILSGGGGNALHFSLGCYSWPGGAPQRRMRLYKKGVTFAAHVHPTGPLAEFVRAQSRGVSWSPDVKAGKGARCRSLASFILLMSHFAVPHRERCNVFPFHSIPCVPDTKHGATYDTVYDGCLDPFLDPWRIPNLQMFRGAPRGPHRVKAAAWGDTHVTLLDQDERVKRSQPKMQRAEVWVEKISTSLRDNYLDTMSPAFSGNRRTKMGPEDVKGCEDQGAEKDCT